MCAAHASEVFEDCTAQTGLTYQHYTGRFTKANGMNSRYLPESLGPGVAVIDYNNDQLLDILVSNGATFAQPNDNDPTNTTPSTTSSPRLFKNLGNLRFTDVTHAANLAHTLHGMGILTADLNGDYRDDVMTMGWGGLRLFYNEGNGRFKDVTSDVGLSAYNSRDQNTPATTPTWFTQGVAFDIDGDLDLDLLLANYVNWSEQTDIHIGYDARTKGYSSPKMYSGMHPIVFLQENGRFVNATRKAGLQTIEGKTLGIALWDFNNDNKLDVFLANDTMQNHLLINHGDGQFMERSVSYNVAYGDDGNSRAGMGVDIARYLNNGETSIAIGNFSQEPTSFFVSKNQRAYRDKNSVTGIRASTLDVLTFGLMFSDADMDGWLDIVQVNGHVEPDIEMFYDEEHYKQPVQVLKNTGDGGFRNLPLDKIGKHVGRALALGDLDNDGDQDVVITENGGALHILCNNSRNNYIRIKLRGIPPNTNAIGATVKVLTAQGWQYRLTRPGSSYLSQSEYYHSIGLGGSIRADTVIVQWPDGLQTVKRNVKANTTLILQQPIESPSMR